MKSLDTDKYINRKSEKCPDCRDRQSPRMVLPSSMPGSPFGDLIKRLGAQLLYSTRRDRHWWVESGGEAFALRIHEYSRGIWRVCASGKEHGFTSVKREIRERMAVNGHGYLFELSFLPDELEEMTEFILEHLSTQIESDPEWLCPHHGTLVGNPFRGYHWTKAAYDTRPS